MKKIEIILLAWVLFTIEVYAHEPLQRQEFGDFYFLCPIEGSNLCEVYNRNNAHVGWVEASSRISHGKSYPKFRFFEPVVLASDDGIGKVLYSFQSSESEELGSYLTTRDDLIDKLPE